MTQIESHPSITYDSILAQGEMRRNFKWSDDWLVIWRTVAMPGPNPFIELFDALETPPIL